MRGIRRYTSRSPLQNRGFEKIEKTQVLEAKPLKSKNNFTVMNLGTGNLEFGYFVTVICLQI